MGNRKGDLVGRVTPVIVGKHDGDFAGSKVGIKLGLNVGEKVEKMLGIIVGSKEGQFIGTELRRLLGINVGIIPGEGDVEVVGTVVGPSARGFVGLFVGI